MSYSVRRPSAWSQIGTGIGQGISEALPKEIERARLAQGLKQFEKDAANLNPMEQLTRLASIPGALERPQLLQSFTELAKQSNIRNAYRNRYNQREEQAVVPSQAPSIKEVNFANLPRGGRGEQPAARETNIPSGFQTRTEEAEAQPGARTKNPLSEDLLPRTSWTPERRDDEILKILDQFEGNIPLQDAVKMAADNEARYLALPREQQAIEDRKEEINRRADEEFDTQLQTILQKEGKEVYGDLTGETLLNLKKAMRNDLATNPRLIESTAAEKWIKKGKDLATAKQQVKVLANRDLPTKLLPNKKEQTIKKLQSAQKIFDETGNNRELYNILKTKNTPPQYDEKGNMIDPGSYGFDLSPGAASLIAFPRSESIKQLIKNSQNFGDLPSNQLGAATRKFALDVLKNITGNDSLLAITREMKNKNPYFDEGIFFDTIRENQQNLTPRMKEELITGESDIFPNWGDIALFPAFTKSVAHD